MQIRQKLMQVRQMLTQLRKAAREKTQVLFTLRGEIPKELRVPLGVIGFAFLITIWWAIIKLGWAAEGVFPMPWRVITAFPELHFKDYVVWNAWTSIKLNLQGYTVAVAIAIPLGFVLGLLPICRGMFERHIVALRFLPLTALIGTFITWFGLSSLMKVNFLAAGILVYLLPTVIQRVDEVEQNYVDITHTLGGRWWHQMRYVFVPAVLSRISDDIRVLVAISWTYIVFAEIVNGSEGGLGQLIFKAGRQSRIDKVFACLLIFIVIGFIQDRIFLMLDKWFFRHKHC